MFGNNPMMIIWLFTCIATLIVTVLIIAKWYRPEDMGNGQE